MMSLRIRELIKEKGTKENGLTSISALAEKAGLTQASMSNIVNRKASPSLDTLERIAKAIGVEVWELFERTGTTDLTAFVEYKEDIYKAETIEELEKIVSEIRKQIGGTGHG